ncbi:TPA: hypothetical protein NII30_003631 [Pseudomonas aeruginosa]|nr:hypothetical protein [Pseudomonas aeruginosa]
MTPELIKNLEHAVAGVLDVVAGLDSRSAHRTTLKSVLRKLRITRELSSLYYICVAGSQSAGKTRLVRELYELNGEHEWLVDNQGRGERVPVFILETDCTAPYAVGVRYKAGPDGSEEEALDKASFRRIVSAYDVNDDYLFTKLYVPKRYFAAQSFGLVLLPGYETLNRENAEWQGLMRHTLIHSLGSVLVTDRTRIADNAQLRILDDLRSKYFPDRKPVIAVTKTETLEGQQIEELTATVADVFGVPSEERDRIVCTGVSDDDYRTRWARSIMDVVGKYALSSAGSESVRIEELERILNDELDNVSAALREEAAGEGISEHLKERQVEKVRAAFRKASDRYRRGYSKELRNNMMGYASHTISIAMARYVAEEEGFKAKLRQAGNFLAFQSGEHEQRFHERIVDCWNSVGDNAQSPLISDYRAITDMSRKELDIEPPEEGKLDLPQQSLQNLIGHGEARQNITDEKLLELRHDLRLLIGQNLAEKESNELQLLKGEQLEEVLRQLPAMTMEYVRISQAIALRKPELLNKELANFDFNKLQQEIERELPQAQKTFGPLIKSIAAIMAVDVAIDGQFDVLNTITGGSAAAGLGASLSMAAAGAIALGFIAYKTANQVQAYDAAKKGFIRESLTHFAETHIQKSLELYDDLMENLDDRMTRNLRLAYGLGGELTKHDSLTRNLHRMDVARTNVIKALDRG